MFLGVLEFIRECSFLLKIGTTLIGIFIIISCAYKMSLKKEKKAAQKRTKKK